MRFIFHRVLNSKSSPVTYNLGKIMLYYLGEKIHLSGLSESYFFYDNYFQSDDVIFKLKVLIKTTNGEIQEQYIEALKDIKAYPKIKNKNSALIVNYNKLKNEISNHFENHIKEHYLLLAKLFDLHFYKELIDHDRVNFYHLEESHSIFSNPKITALNDILSLQLPEEDGECPILFLTNNDTKGEINYEFECVSYDNENADVLTASYLTDVFQFPAVLGIPKIIMEAITHDFSSKTVPIKEQLHQWAKTCYESPNSTVGITYFREHIAPIIEDYKKICLETKMGKQLLETSIPDNYGFIQFGEMPITKIWELMLANENCTEEEYQELLKLKETQAPKYDGRWPVAFFKEIGMDNRRKEEEDTKTPTTRKTLDID
ncbi:hypothetical protein ACSVH2_01645 [Flavobacterium sp. RSB2_4_14]|uniref:hypothetical protein n=1 Tax=Flavobacterium sp. RSB2_4_14 TaxID=3447665 RepID=UPI003F2B75AC